jgi:hypothetical protein
MLLLVGELPRQCVITLIARHRAAAYLATHVLVQIGPKGGRRHNSPLIAPPFFEGDAAEGPLGDERNVLLQALPLLS